MLSIIIKPAGTSTAIAMETFKKQLIFLRLLSTELSSRSGLTKQPFG